VKPLRLHTVFILAVRAAAALEFVRVEAQEDLHTDCLQAVFIMQPKTRGGGATIIATLEPLITTIGYSMVRRATKTFLKRV